jgi:hypothetical protein
VSLTTTENLKVAVVEFQRLAQAAAPPERALAHVSQVLNRFPQMELDTITWSVGKLDERARGAKPPGAPAPPPAAGRAEANGDLAVQIELVGRVNSTQRNDYRGLTAQVESFVAALTMAGYELVERKLPFDVTSEGTLTGDMAMGGGEGGEAPRFTVVIARRLP